MHLIVCEKRIDSFAQKFGKLSGAVWELGYAVTVGKKLFILPDTSAVCPKLLMTSGRCLTVCSDNHAFDKFIGVCGNKTVLKKKFVFQELEEIVTACVDSYCLSVLFVVLQTFLSQYFHVWIIFHVLHSGTHTQTNLKTILSYSEHCFLF
jgi:hypothetical protein